ncbi:MAG: hypothetical protein N2559_15630, partial [Anaerolineae bacterium]|nr:hypothetical protein [Anaerolineae bacterium]
MKRSLLFVCFVAGLALVLLGTTAIAQSAPREQAADPKAACEKLKDLKLPNTTITTAEYVNPIQESPGVIIRGVWATPASAHGATTVDLPFCRVVGVSTPAIGFE